MSDDQDLDKCLEKASEVFPTAMDFHNSADGWEEIDASRSMTVFKRMTEFGFNSYKISGYINKPCKDLAMYMFENWPDLEMTYGNMQALENIRSFSDGSKIRYELTPSFGPISSREGWIFTSLQEMDDQSWVILDTSAPLNYEPKPGNVSGDFKFRIQVFSPMETDASKSHIGVAEIIDPKGNIPPLIINQLASEKSALWKGIFEKLASI